MIGESINTQAIKCPHCTHNIQIQVGRYVGGVNDYGGWVLQCEQCQGLLPVEVTNPNDLSCVQAGATVLASWDDEVENKAEVLSKHGLGEDEPRPKRLLVKEFGVPEDFYDLGTRPLYRCQACGNPLDPIAFDALGAGLPELTRRVQALQIFARRYDGRADMHDGLRVEVAVTCPCGVSHRAQFHREFTEAAVSRVGEFWLVDVDGTVESIDVDGVYTRDQCITILEKLLLRWRATHQAVLLAAPFIGFNYPGARKKIPDLWNWVLKYTDPERTSLVTRRGTYKLFEAETKGTAMDVQFLKSWGILNPTVEALTRKKAAFKQKFHAKFYCGMSADRVEVLVGSFNIHKGDYVENIHLRSYTYEEFAKRYLVGMALGYDIEQLQGERQPFRIQL